MSSPIDAYHLPASRAAPADWEVRDYESDVSLRFPKLGPAELADLLRGLRRAGARHLATRPVAEIVATIDRAAAELARPEGEARQLLERALPAITGYSPEMIRLILDRMVQDWREPALRALLEAEFGDPHVLDGFQPRPPEADGIRTRAYGAEAALHIFAGNVPGVAVTSLIRSILVKTPVLGKTAAGEPLLAAVFARILAELDPGIGECMAVTYWTGGQAALDTAALQAADLVVAYGGEPTVESIRAHVRHGQRLVVYGPRLSLGLVACDALAAHAADDTVGAVARAVAIFDQQGCVSPHLVYVEEGGDTAPVDFAERLAAHMDKLETELPRGRISIAEAARIQEARSVAEFRGIAGAGTRVLASHGTAHTVIYDPDPVFEPSCLNRLVRVKPVRRLEEVLESLRPYAGYLQTAAVAGATDRLDQLAGLLAQAGISRITSFERMPWPPPHWHHDGRPPLQDLVSWTDIESS